MEVDHFAVGPWYGYFQGSVMGQTKYIIMMHTDPMGIIIRKHGLDNHFYAGDKQLDIQRI